MGHREGRIALVLVACAGCGRLGYDDLLLTDAGSVDAPPRLDVARRMDAAAPPADARRPEEAAHEDAAHPPDVHALDAGLPMQDAARHDAKPKDAGHDAEPRDATGHDVTVGMDAGHEGGTAADAHIDGGSTPLDGGELFTPFALPAGSSPWGITVGPDNRIWFTISQLGTTGTGAIGVLDPTTSTMTFYSTGLTPGATPWGITVGPDGNLWFTDRAANSQIGRITEAGVITEYTSETTNGASPWAICQAAASTAGLVFTEETGNEVVFAALTATTGTLATPQLSPATAPWGVLLYTRTSGGQFVCYTSGHGVDCLQSGFGEPPTGYQESVGESKPYGLTEAPGGAIWFTDNALSTIATFTPSTDGNSGMPTGYPTPTLDAGPYMITPGPSGSTDLWFTEYNVGKVARAAISSGAPTFTEFPIGGSAKPAGIVVDASGNVWFAAFAGGFIGELQVDASPG